MTPIETRHSEVSVQVREADLPGILSMPAQARGTVIFAHGSGSSRLSPRNRQVADYFNDLGLATLLFDLLTEAESSIDQRTAALRFDIDLLSRRLGDAVKWLSTQPAATIPAASRRLGLFGASTGAAAALVATAQQPESIAAVVSRGGRPDLAGDALENVVAPTLLIVGGLDQTVIELNERAALRLRCRHQISIVPGATHLFEEAGALAQVAKLAGDWFLQYLADFETA